MKVEERAKQTHEWLNGCKLSNERKCELNCYLENSNRFLCNIKRNARMRRQGISFCHFPRIRRNSLNVIGEAQISASIVKAESYLQLFILFTSAWVFHLMRWWEVSISFCDAAPLLVSLLRPKLMVLRVTRSEKASVGASSVSVF